ncbi:hypothetical protein [Nonomuraea sp. NPDC052265]|uniref:hypothetical protein n=1 Tax=Nonomuraea sp. NPDC052265 TaxID=3364374 RepID=UPI0037C9EB4A
MTQVWVTGAGDCHHSSEDCRDLKAGQSSAGAQGFEVRPVTRMELHVAEAAGRSACGTCGGATR